MSNKKLKVGDTVEWQSIGKKRQAKILKVKDNGDLILDSAQLGLCKNVCVKPHRVKKLLTPHKPKQDERK